MAGGRLEAGPRRPQPAGELTALGLNWPGRPSPLPLQVDHPLCLFQVGDPRPEPCLLQHLPAKTHKSNLPWRGQADARRLSHHSTAATLKPRPPPQSPPTHSGPKTGSRTLSPGAEETAWGGVFSPPHFLREKACRDGHLPGRCDGPVGAASPTHLRCPGPSQRTEVLRSTSDVCHGYRRQHGRCACCSTPDPTAPRDHSTPFLLRETKNRRNKDCRR